MEEIRVYVVLVVIFFFFKQKTAYEMLRSLVGSEMCIRDSHKTALTKHTLNPIGGAERTTKQEQERREQAQQLNFKHQMAEWVRRETHAVREQWRPDPEQHPDQACLFEDIEHCLFEPVSYTHLTLPTKRIE
eukprot:TRINITY_DN38697_c0_g1_i1.p1 TRINITY_DN38697_c0_g1~~TRINITY_DN38697_c0_g1_i1.p1  ORF type:complete len:132 (+),score=52.73 TRINITY_DN38697_c0_g1_i1:4-399(+)